MASSHFVRDIRIEISAGIGSSTSMTSVRMLLIAIVRRLANASWQATVVCQHGS